MYKQVMSIPVYLHRINALLISNNFARRQILRRPVALSIMVRLVSEKLGFTHVIQVIIANYGYGKNVDILLY